MAKNIISTCFSCSQSAASSSNANVHAAASSSGTAQGGADPSIEHLLDQILNTRHDAQDFDLDGLIKNIDELLASLDKESSRLPSLRTSSCLGLMPSASETSKVLEGVADSVQNIATQLSAFSGDARKTTIHVLNAVGNVHWAAVGFLLVATVLQRFDAIKSNRTECLKMLKSMSGLAKIIKDLKPLPYLNDAIQGLVKESISLIVNGSIACCSLKKASPPSNFCLASKNSADLVELRSQVDSMYRNLEAQMTTSIYQAVHGVHHTDPHFLYPENAVEITEKMEKVIELLEWKSEKSTVAVVLHGIGGAGKTTLADAVYARLNFDGWKCSKVSLTENLESDPQIEKLQSRILEDLTGEEQRVTEFRAGQHQLKGIIQKENVFIYIDNVLRKEHLKKLLPDKIVSPKRIRMLLTARNQHVAEVIEECLPQAIENCCKIYLMENLSEDAALQLLLRKIGAGNDKTQIINKNPKVRDIAKTCSCCPLVLEIVGAYLHKCKYSHEASHKVFKWLDSLEHFSFHKEDHSFETKLFFAYEDLTEPAQEAFLDICSFFYNWNWDETACVVGEDELESLKEGALVKREFDRVKIHDLLLATGRAKAKGSRVNNALDLSNALSNEESLRQIKGISLLHNKRPFHISAEKLDLMNDSLHVFEMGDWTVVKGNCTGQFHELRYLQAGRVYHMPFNITRLRKLTFLDDRSEADVVLSLSEMPPTLKVLKLMELGRSRKLEMTSNVVDGSKDLRTLKLRNILESTKLLEDVNYCSKLKELELTSCINVTKLPQTLCKLFDLRTLSLKCCTNLKELPESLHELRGLQVLNLSHCTKLNRLPEQFELLSSLEELRLSGCYSLKELPESFGLLCSLKKANLSGCWSLKELPDGFGSLCSLKVVDLSYCQSLKELPGSFGSLRSLEEVLLIGCGSLQELPSSFEKLSSIRLLDIGHCGSLHELPEGLGKLTSLVHLRFYGCEKLKRLPESFGRLTSLDVNITMDRCLSLTQLPETFCDLSRMETISLSSCSNLGKLPKRFQELACLRRLNLSGCESLSRLTEGFGKLSCLEELDLGGCRNLVELSTDFHCLASLRRLCLSECEKLGGTCMKDTVNIEPLRFVDIAGSPSLELRWSEMEPEQEEWQFVAHTTYSDLKKNGLQMASSRFFRDKHALVNAHGQPFYPSSLPSDTTFLLVFHPHPDIGLQRVEEALRLQSTLNYLQIIYIGMHLSSLPSGQASRFLAYTDPNNSEACLFFHKTLSIVQFRDFCDSSRIIETKITVAEGGCKYFSEWQDISYSIQEMVYKASGEYLRMKQLVEIPQGSNNELLRTLLMTAESDFQVPLDSSRLVNVDDLKDKLILLLISARELSEAWISALKEMYLKIKAKHNVVLEVIWLRGVGNPLSNWGPYERSVRSAPWPVIPLSIESTVYRFLIEACGNRSFMEPRLMVVDPKGQITCRGAMKMIERWGVDAYPFTNQAEEELITAEWDGLKDKSSLSFLFQNLDSLVTVNAALHRRQMIWLYGGNDPSEISEFTRRLSCARERLGENTQILYIGGLSDDRLDWWNPLVVEEEAALHEKNREAMSWPSLSGSHSWRFWKRVDYLFWEMSERGESEKIARLRRLVVGLLCVGWRGGAWMKRGRL